jgi:NAD(P)-dependent dehydrogenase (short-subunit alcohol dehydrogenase family)
MKHILVTGGAKGIGRAIVEALAAAAEYKITATYFGSNAAADEIAASYPAVRFVKVDLQDRQALAAFITDLLAAEPIDVLVNNAGLYVGKPFENMTLDEVFQQIDLNFTAPTQLIHGLLPLLKKAKAPLIINISSQAVHERISGEAMYTAVKTALSTLAYVLRAELNPEGVRFVTVEPFGVNTYGLDEPSSMILPEELAKMVLYAIEMPDHLQLDNLGISHLKQSRPDYPDWIEQ